MSVSINTQTDIIRKKKNIRQSDVDKNNNFVNGEGVAHPWVVMLITGRGNCERQEALKRSAEQSHRRGQGFRGDMDVFRSSYRHSNNQQDKTTGKKDKKCGGRRKKGGDHYERGKHWKKRQTLGTRLRHYT
ncbi:hypothetical protein ATANTOWER_018058 [Ataeniobius toweri]|uniref:Uncharacterized protein n=1 Tax=Ataeniobius toweri TaxID=208326 RepID=A0ABU7AIR8_9TELE|nr:hypothetical protein [Ataeniobius toweri]